MKKVEIEIGRTFTNDKGRFRRITGAGEQFKLYDSQTDSDCLEFVEWITVRKRKAGAVVHVLKTVRHPVYGNDRRDEFHFHITRSSFAAWARREATVDEMIAVDAVK